MPAVTLTTLRVGETVRVQAIVKDELGQPLTEVDAPSFDPLAGPGTIVNVFLVSGEPLMADVEGASPGPDTLEFSCRDSFDNAIIADAAVLVLDAERLVFSCVDVEHCAIRTQQGRFIILVDPEPAGTPSFTLKIRPADARESKGGIASYVLSDGPNSVSTHGRILLNGNGAGTPVNDDAEVACTVTARGEEIINATATTDATGTVIMGQAKFLIVTAATATIEQVI